jgi:hypothetical protein
MVFLVVMATQEETMETQEETMAHMETKEMVVPQMVHAIVKHTMKT